MLDNWRVFLTPFTISMASQALTHQIATQAVYRAVMEGSREHPWYLAHLGTNLAHSGQLFFFLWQGIIGYTR